MVHMKPAKIED